MVSLVLVAALLAAQGGATGRLHGRVMDSSGAVLTGTAVIVRRTSSGETVETKTDQRGSYAVDRLAAGNYIVSVAAAGFAETHEAVTIGAGADRGLDIRLAIAVQRHEILVASKPAEDATDPSANAAATVIKGQDLDALSDDPRDAFIMRRGSYRCFRPPKRGSVYQSSASERRCTAERY